ncbi:MAG TPA: PDZ domain-containing protein [Pirellulales bacterium]|nr:PDZ domain-containing protein [Pirellulales bacterium]
MTELCRCAAAVHHIRQSRWLFSVVAAIITMSVASATAAPSEAPRASRVRRTAAPAAGALGVRLRDLGAAGVEIAAVLPNSPAADAGLRAGDRILRVDNTPVANSREVIRLVSASGPEVQVELEIDRQGLRGPLEVTLASPGDVFRRAALGVTFSKSSYGGARVLRVLPESPAAKAGLRMGDRILSVNGKKVANYREAISRIGRSRPNTPLDLQVDRYGLKGTLSAMLGSAAEVFAPRAAVRPAAPVVSPPTPAEVVEALSPAMVNDQRSYGD